MTYIYLSSLLISFFLILITYSRRVPNPRLHRNFCLFLLLTCVVELTGEVIRRQGVHNIWLINCFSLAEFIIYSLFYKTQLSSIRLRKTASIFAVTFPFLFALNVAFLQPLFTSFHTYTYLLGSLFMVICAGAYLYEQVFLEQNLDESLLRKPFFWVSIGILFFYAGTFIIFGAINYLFNASMELAANLFKIVQVLNILMYALFAIGFSCHKIFRRYHF